MDYFMVEATQVDSAQDDAVVVESKHARNSTEAEKFAKKFVKEGYFASVYRSGEYCYQLEPKQ